MKRTVVKEVKERQLNFFGAALGALTVAFSIAAVIGNAPSLAIAIAILGGVLSLISISQVVVRKVEQEVEEDVERTEEIVEIVESPPSDSEREATRLRISVVRIRLPVLLCPAGPRRLLLDGSGAAGTTTLRLSRLRDVQALQSSIAAYKELLALPIPVVLTDEEREAEAALSGDAQALHGLEARIASSLERVRQCVTDVETVELEVPLLREEALPPLHRATRLAGPPNDPRLLARLRDAVIELRRSDRSLSADEFTDALSSIEWHLERLAEVRELSLQHVMAPLCVNLGQDFHYSAFNFFCPECNRKAQIDALARDYAVANSNAHAPIGLSANSRCSYNMARGDWECRACGRQTSNPVPVHRLLDEILLPTFDRLMEENKNERIATYHDARSRDLEYANAMQTELENLHQRNRSDVESLLQEQGRLSAQAAGEEEAIEGLASVQRAYNVKQSAFLASMLAGHAAIVQEIAQSRREAHGEMHAAFLKERDAMTSAMQQCSRAKRIEDEKRDGVMRDIAVNMRKTAVASERTAQNTTTMVSQLGRIEVNTARTAAATEQTATNTAQMVQLQRKSNAIQAATAEQLGVERSPAWYDVGGWVDKGVADVSSGILGEDAIARHTRYNNSNFD
ncbi:MAG: hypothetical protein IPN47_23945 [Gemmatimonadetes bacterium]|nr:hypothetical protein [Gemmatimonadota bacterium]